MALRTTTDTARVDANLRELWAEVDGMPETAAEWATYDDEVRLDFALEWWNLLGGFLNLVDAETDDKLTADQYQRYERLVHRYEEVLPLIEQLGLQTIPVPKLATRRS